MTVELTAHTRAPPATGRPAWSHPLVGMLRVTRPVPVCFRPVSCSQRASFLKGASGALTSLVKPDDKPVGVPESEAVVDKRPRAVDVKLQMVV